MSLLADLLSRTNRKEQNSAIPPNLTKVVRRGSDKRRVEMRIKVVFAITVLLVACGFATVYFTNRYLESATPVATSRRLQAPQSFTDAQPPGAKSGTAAQQSAGIEHQKTGPAAASKKEETAAAGRVPVPKEKPKGENGKIAPVKAPLQDGQQKDTVAGVAAPPVAQAPQPDKSRTVSAAEESPNAERDNAIYAARAYEQNRKYGQAIAQYKIALGKDPGNYLIMNNIADILIRSGSPGESIQYSVKALSAHRDYVPSLINLGIANIEIGNASEGETYLLRAKSLEQNNKTVLFSLGVLYEKLTNYPRSMAAFRELAETKDTRGYLGMARILEKQGKYPEAEKVYREVLSTNNIDAATKQLANERLLAIGNR